ncbi:MAG TPA: hypothetical protein VEU97_01915 [Ktedonobacteraceae bacterium]|nr:hypothetical protein [Ktedonobacteraceae bacterium]
MRRRAKNTRKTFSPGIFVGIFLFVGTCIFVLFHFFPLAGTTDTRPSVMSTPTTPAIRSVPAVVINQYYTDLAHNDYKAAYALLSTNVHNHLDALGGIAYMQQELQMLTEKYGAITSYSITKTTKDVSNGQMILTLLVHRLNFHTNQTETDNYTMTLEPGGWSIDKWTTDIHTD